MYTLAVELCLIGALITRHDIVDELPWFLPFVLVI